VTFSKKWFLNEQRQTNDDTVATPDKLRWSGVNAFVKQNQIKEVPMLEFGNVHLMTSVL
jgi:hypothetical protein